MIVILKPRTLPEKMVQEFCLLTHLEKNTPQYTNLKTDFTNHQLGYIGEKKLDYYLDFLPDIGTYILHGLRLNGINYAFQMDTLFLTPFFCLVTEIKNLGGSLFFDKHSKQCFQTLNTIKKGIKNPLAQAERQAEQLRKKLHLLGIYQLPIEYCAIVCSSSTKIETNPGNERLFESVFHMEHIIDLFRKLTAKYKIKAITDKKLEKLGKILALEHTPLILNLIDKYSIKSQNLKTGIVCLLCLNPMIRLRRAWCCTSCHSVSNNAFEISLLHYLLNLNPTVTNKQWRDFIGTSSKDVSFKMLNALSYIERLATNYKKYTLSSDWATKIDLEELILSTQF